MDRPEEPRPPPVPGRGPERDRSFGFSSGEVISTSFRIFGRHLPTLLGLAALFHALPTFLSVQHARATSHLSREPGVHFGFEGPYGIVAALASRVLPLAFQAVVT